MPGLYQGFLYVLWSIFHILYVPDYGYNYVRTLNAGHVAPEGKFGHAHTQE